MRYAIVEDNIITNMIELNPIDAPHFPNAVYADEWNIQIGDTYDAEEQYFYHNGERILSEREKICELQNALTLLMGEYISPTVTKQE